MIGQYLPNNNENSYSAVLQKQFGSKPALKMKGSMHLNHSSASLLEPKAASLATAATKACLDAPKS
jgi:hypothetical protein